MASLQEPQPETAQQEEQQQEAPVQQEQKDQPVEVVEPQVEESPQEAQEEVSEGDVEEQKAEVETETEVEAEAKAEQEEAAEEEQAEAGEETPETEAEADEGLSSQLMKDKVWKDMKDIEGEEEKSAEEQDPEQEQGPEQEHSVEAEEEEEDQGPNNIRDVLKLSQETRLQFGVVFPGMIKEQKLMIENPSKLNLTLKVKVDCHNQEFDDLEEYVYSIRKPPQFDYNDTYYVIMNEKDFITFQVAIKVPKIRDMKTMHGEITISSEECEGSFSIRLEAEVTPPTNPDRRAHHLLPQGALHQGAGLQSGALQPQVPAQEAGLPLPHQGELSCQHQVHVRDRVP